MYREIRIVSVRKEVNDIVILSFESVDTDVNIKYKAGQFLTFVFKRENGEIRRSYSICSSPDANEPLSVAVKRIDNGEISRFLHHEVSVGDVLTVTEPTGFFTYDSIIDKKRTVFLFAAGVGITPLFSILKTALLSEIESKIVLIYSNRSAESGLFLDELKNWSDDYSQRFTLINLFSNAKNLRRARLNSFLIGELIAENMHFAREDALFYCCGPVDYMDLCRISLLGNGYLPEQIKRETFVLHEDEMDEDDLTEKIVDKSTYSVTLRMGAKEHHLTVPYPKRILDVALEAGIRIPYSCSGGVCGTCIGQCISGGVQMAYNEVLTDEEVLAGKVLVCTGRPTQNDTVIEWK